MENRELTPEEYADKCTLKLAEAMVINANLRKAGEGLFLRMDYFMGDTDPLDDQDENVLACQAWREAYSLKTKTN